ncbi:hypothetical protein [Streptomyces sp. NPDC085665]|uniref:hypothetical protein n=1 Tax=Streptomyces sp. NPDC085665 TaxID=3365735 RepID=UPI0037D7776F
MGEDDAPATEAPTAAELSGPAKEPLAAADGEDPTGDVDAPDALPEALRAPATEEYAVPSWLAVDEDFDDDVMVGNEGEQTPAVPAGLDVPEVVPPYEDDPLEAPAAEHPELRKSSPLWGTDDLPVSAYTGAENGLEEPAEAADGGDLVSGFAEFQEAWDVTVTVAGTSAELADDVHADLITLQDLITEALSDVSPRESSAPPEEPESAPERDEHQEAAAVNASLKQADAHADSFQDLPEWQKIQTVRGAMGHLVTVIMNRAGEQLDRLLGDERAAGFLRELSALACDKIAELAQAAARKLRGEDARGADRGGDLPSAATLLRLGEAAGTFSTPRRGRGGRRSAPADRGPDRLGIPAMRKMGEALAKPMPEVRRTVSAAAARGRSTTKRYAKKPASDTAEQAGHLRRAANQNQPSKPQHR